MKKYGVILADPPWDYEVSHRRGAAANHYPTMTIDKMKQLPIANLAKSNAVLLMWATWPKLYEGVQGLIEEWGFTYVTGFPWVKVQSIDRDLFDGQIWITPQWGTGYWVRGASEIVLIAKRGKPKLPDAPPVGLLCERAIHSKKPKNLHEYAKTLPGPYLELFARRPHPGWDVFGNEVENSITLPVNGATP